MAHNPRLLGGLAVLVSAGLVAGATGLYLAAGEEEETKAVSPQVTSGVAPSPTPLPTFSTPSPTAAPTSSPTAAATATPSASPSATASASPGPSRTGGSTTYAYPKPTRTYDGLRLSATMNPGDGFTTTTFRLSVTASDGDGTIYLESIDWGDGTRTTTPNPQACKSYPPLTSPPGAYSPQADSYDKAFTHRYTRTGTFTVRVTVTSVNKDCRPNGPARESRTAVFDGSDAVTVSAPESSPSPTP